MLVFLDRQTANDLCNIRKWVNSGHFVQSDTKSNFICTCIKTEFPPYLTWSKTSTLLKNEDLVDKQKAKLHIKDLVISRTLTLGRQSKT